MEQSLKKLSRFSIHHLAHYEMFATVYSATNNQSIDDDIYQVALNFPSQGFIAHDLSCTKKCIDDKKES